MGMKQSIIDWLESVPGPTEVQARLWRRVFWGLVGLAVLAEILLWYVLYPMDVNDPPGGLNVLAGWLLENVPAAQGVTNFSYTLRDKMPYVFLIGFSLSMVVALGFAFFNNNRVILRALPRVVSFPINKFFLAVFGEVSMIFLVVVVLFIFPAGVTYDADKMGVSSVYESDFSMMLYWIPKFFLIGAILGQHLAFLRDLVVRVMSGRAV